jgi:putative transposase
MARLPRYSIVNQPQHIILQGRDGQSICFEEQDYQYFHDCLDAAAYNYNLKLHAYVIMPNHAHVLATPGNSDSVSRMVQSLGRNYVQYFNECYEGTGTLWEGRYRATVVDAKNYMLTCSRYIELNPVRAGLVDKPLQYQWSSYAHNAQGQQDEMITTAREYQRLGESDAERSKAYRQLFRQKLDAQLVQDITDSALKGWVLGDARFAAKIEKLSGRRATQLPKGRPRKAKS